jgi:hypothetical protein
LGGFGKVAAGTICRRLCFKGLDTFAYSTPGERSVKSRENKLISDHLLGDLLVRYQSNFHEMYWENKKSPPVSLGTRAGFTVFLEY